MSEVKQPTKNGRPQRFSIPGTSLSTDAVGLKMYDDLQAKYVGKPMSFRPLLARDLKDFYKKLWADGRLFKDGEHLR